MTAIAFSGGGVTAGIDFGLTLLAETRRRGCGQVRSSSALEYDPQPPFQSGSPEKAGAGAVARLKVRTQMEKMIARRQEANATAAARLA